MASTPSACACPTSRSRSSCCARSVVASPRRRRTASAASSPTTAADVRADLGDDVDVVLDGGPCRVGVESTIVDCSGPEPAILRVGGVARGRVEALLGVTVPCSTGGEVAAPGTLASHYAPRARGRAFTDARRDRGSRADAAIARGERVGVIGAAAGRPRGSSGSARRRRRRVRARALPHVARGRRRELDVVLAVVPDDTGLGAAVADRLRRAAAGRRRRDARRPIGVFDSGLGGLTVLRALIDLLPDERSSTSATPVDSRTGRSRATRCWTTRSRSPTCCSAHDVKMLVVACNSAAAAALDALHERLDDPGDRGHRARGAGRGARSPAAAGSG